MTCAGIAWPWVLAGCAAAAAFYFLLGLLRKRSGMSLAESYTAAFGEFAGRVLLGLTAVWTLLALARTVSGAAAAFPEGDGAGMAPAVLAALTAWVCIRGENASARCAAVLAPLLAGLYLILLAAALPDVKREWCGLWGENRGIPEAGSAMLLPTAALFLREGEEGKGKRAWWLLGVMAAGPAAMALAASGRLSPQVVRAEKLPFYSMTKSLSILSVMERFEPVLSVALLIGMFCMAALLAECAAKLGCAALGTERRKWHCAALCAAAFGLSFGVDRLPEELWSAGAALFWGLTVILAQVVVGIKKDEKKEKKELTNGGESGKIAERSREGATTDVRPEQKTSKNEEKSS